MFLQILLIKGPCFTFYQLFTSVILTKKVTRRPSADEYNSLTPHFKARELSDDAHKGSLYTLFMHSPLRAFCFVTNIVDIPIHLWDKCLAYIDRFMTEASRLITRSRGVGECVCNTNTASNCRTKQIKVL